METQQPRGRVSSSCVAAQAATAASSKTHPQRINLHMRRPVAVARPPALLGDSQRSTATGDDGGRGGFDAVRRHCYRRRYFLLTGVVTVAALTWMGMRKKGTVFSILETAANAATETPAATPLERSDGVTQLEDVLPALSYHALLSPLVWIICLSGFCLLHGFCKQLLLLLRQQRGKRIAKFALLVQSNVFPVHGINRLMSMTHALIAINWGVLIFLKRDNASSRSAARHSASVASAEQAVTVSSKLVAAASGVSGILQSPGLSEAPTLGAAGGTTAALHETGAASMCCLWGFGEPVTSHERALLLFSLSYFIYDTWYEGLYGDLYECIHHGVAILGLLHVLGRNVGGRDLIAAMIAGELSTPLLHLRYCCVQLANRLAAVATTSQGGDQTSSTRAASRTDATVERLPTATSTLQQQEQHQQQGGREQLHNDNKGRHRVDAGMAGKGLGKDPSTASTAQASTVSSDVSGLSQRRSLTAHRITCSAAAGTPAGGGGGSTSLKASPAPSVGAAPRPGSRLGGSIKSSPPETAAAAHAEGRSDATSRIGRESSTGIRGAENRASVAAARITGREEGVSVAQAKRPQKYRKKGAQTAAPAGESEEAVETTHREERGRSAVVTGSGVLPPQGASATPQTAESCRSLLGSQSLSSSSSYVAAGAARSIEASDDRRPPRLRNETFISSASDVHIPIADPACTTGAAAVLAAALSTAVAAAAMGAGTPPGVATAAASAAAVCSFIIFYLVLRLSQRGGDPNSMFATFFHIPAGYVYPSSPRSHTPPNESGSTPAVGRCAVESSCAASANDAAATTLEQEVAVFAETFLKGNGDKLQLCRDALERSFFSTFIIGRALLAPCVVYACVSCPSTPILARASGIFLLVMSCYWLSRILKYVHKRKRPQEEKKKEPTVFTVKPSTDKQKDEEHDG